MLSRRAVIALFAVSTSALSQPILTTIQDTLYKADGTRFNGSAVISWNTFDAADTSKIGTQSLSIQILDGSLRVQLVPNAGLTPYTVHYSSDGKAQFSETWSVPVSATTLRVRDVRAGATTSNVLPPPGQTPILESDVVGLVADLALRPVEGPGYGYGRTALVNPFGALETVVGNLTDCVHVDGSSSPCSAGAPVPTFVDSESPGGIVDGSNASFSLASTPGPQTSLALYRNGMFQKIGFDFMLIGADIQFVSAATPQPGDTLLASYRLAGSGPVSAPAGLTLATVAFAQVVCSSTGTTTGAVSPVSLGSCAVPAHLFKPGDRAELRFGFAHQGVSSGFDFQVRWGGTTVIHRFGQPGDAMIAGRADAGIGANSTQVTAESWGTLLTFQPTLANASDPLSVPLKIDFLAGVGHGPDSVTLLNYTVLRYPAISHP